MRYFSGRCKRGVRNSAENLANREDFGEQSFLNYGFQSRSEVTLIDREWNFGPWAYLAGLEKELCRNPITLHAFGVPHCDGKLEFLRRWEAALSSRYIPDLSTYFV